MSEWIEVSYQLPKTEGRYLVVDENDEIYIAWLVNKRKRLWCSDDATRIVVTHWDTLPVTPKMNEAMDSFGKEVRVSDE